ncbi:methionyl-tRNA formyltransferase [Pseudohongiella sp.]|uniref:methionyl-tRNA formyltransferase n=1 Tax=marine sediment metagenome TaxID=412755 RepID=A0A0F9VUU1_9ZZZZ|nr:methionyl-tRNA formyltransferase [Pseudohongiella sp.]HDZ08675.1 methionyl-tRNA formyltransferase [Pseudohongiella sp.]HEA62291.1 methionyl-tRNA formyltransferase [Pseudohongiella sp.]
MKLVFAGTPAFAASHLSALIAHGHEIAAVYTQPDRASGRGKKLHASPVKALATEHQLPVVQPASLKDPDAQAALAALAPDLMIVVAYGLLLPKAVLDIPRFGCINVHASLLPRWRGAAPIERALLAGDSETGVTIMQMDVGLDTGDMLYKLSTALTDSDDRQQLEDRLATLGCQGLLYTLAHFDALREHAEKQDDALSTYARKLDKAESQIDWRAGAADIARTIRAGIGRQPAYSLLDGERLRLLRASCSEADQAGDAAPGTILPGHDRNVLSIACTDGVLDVSELQLPGKNPVSVRDIRNSRPALFAAGKRFSSDDAHEAR